MTNKALSGPGIVATHGPSAPPRAGNAATASPWPKSRMVKLLAIGAAAILASSAVGYKVADWQCARRAAAGATAWHGSVGKVVRGGADKSGGLSVMTSGGSASPLAAGAAVGPGMTLMTDPRTRARLVFDDGTTMVLDRATQVTLGESPRSLDVKEGALLADIAPLETDSMIRASVGWMRTKGAKVAITATDDGTSVEVLRGDVEVGDGHSGKAHVDAGQEAAMSRTAHIEVTPANDLGQRAAFGDGFIGEHNEDTDAPVGGLGELRARKPGSKDEKDHAVHLARHDVKVRVVGNLARTEIDETFENDTGDVLEGVYRFPLPPGAEIERLALEVDGKLVEGEFVDKAKAAAIFRGAIHNATPFQPLPKEELIWVPGPWRNPALLEWQHGGRSELRIFPIPKHGSRRVVLAYTETIAPVGGVRRYVYPLPQATASDIKVDHASFDVQVLGSDQRLPVHAKGYELAASKGDGAVRLSQSTDGFTPSGDLVVEYALPDAADMTAWAFADTTPPKPGAPVVDGAGDPYVSLALRPKLPRWTDARPRDQVIVLDAGRAMFGERFQRAKRLAIQLTQEMDRRDRVAVLVCDVTCRGMSGGWKAPGSATAHDADAWLASQTPDGATDLVGAVRAAATAPGRDASRDLRVVLVSDGVASAGYRRHDRLEQEVADALPDARAMVVAVPIGTDADQDTLEAVARGGGGVVVPYQPGEKLEAAALDTLAATYGTTLRDVELTLPDGLYAPAPAKLSPIRAGGETLVSARMRGDHVKGDVVLRGKVGGEPFEAKYALDVGSTTDAANAFVPRLYAAARIADDEHAGRDDAKKEVVALSERFAVPSKYTSLLVLESEAMFNAFGIGRTSRAQTWTGENAAEEGEVTKNKDETASGDDKADDPDGELALGGGRAGGGGYAEKKAASETPAPDTATVSGSFALGGAADRRTAAASQPAPSPPPPPAAHARSSQPRDHEEASPFTGDANNNAGPAPSKPAFAQAPPVMPAPTTTATATTTPPVPANGSSPIAVAPLEPAQRWTPRRRPPSGQWMKRAWFRTSSVRDDATQVVSADKIAAARAALAAAPDERKKHMDLVQLLERTGAVDDLSEEVDRWSSRDPLDADAISARADVLERRGDRDGALRILGGTAAAITDDAALLSALGLAAERAGHAAEACAFRVASAELRPGDDAAVADAVRCERAAGHTASADRWLAGAKNDAARARIEAGAAKTDATARDNTSYGDVVVDATWEGGADVDIAVVNPSGTRLGWGTRGKGVRAADCTSTSHEALAVSSNAAGAFVVELVRGDGVEGASAAPVRGTLKVRGVGGAMRVIPFVLTGTHAELARVDVRWDSQLVAAGDGDFPRR